MLHSGTQPRLSHEEVLFRALCVISSPRPHVCQLDGLQEFFLSSNLLMQIWTSPYANHFMSSLQAQHDEDRTMSIDSFCLNKREKCSFKPSSRVRLVIHQIFYLKSYSLTWAKFNLYFLPKLKKKKKTYMCRYKLILRNTGRWVKANMETENHVET